MEIKRRLVALSKTLSPQIEVMNVAVEMSRMCDRFEELVRYAQEKIDRAEERKGKTLGQQANERREAADKVISDHQTAEAEENQRDQQEAFDERNRDPGAVESEDPDTGGSDGGPVPAVADTDSEVPDGDVPITATEILENQKAAGMDVEVPDEKPPIKRKKKAAKKKAAKKKKGGLFRKKT